MAFSRNVGKVRSPSPLRQEIAAQHSDGSDDEDSIEDSGPLNTSTDSDAQRKAAAKRVFGMESAPAPATAPASAAVVHSSIAPDERSLWMFDQSEELQQPAEYSVDLMDAAEGLWEIEEAQLGALESPVKLAGAGRVVVDESSIPTPKGPRAQDPSRHFMPGPAGSSAPSAQTGRPPISPRKLSDPKPLTFTARPLPPLPPATVSTPVPQRTLTAKASIQPPSLQLASTAPAPQNADPPSARAIARQGKAIEDMIAAVLNPSHAAPKATVEEGEPPALVTFSRQEPSPRETGKEAVDGGQVLQPALVVESKGRSTSSLRRSTSVASTHSATGHDDLFERRQRDARQNIGIDLSNQSSSSPPEARPAIPVDTSRPLAARLSRSTSLNSARSLASLVRGPIVTAVPAVSAAPAGPKPQPLPAPLASTVEPSLGRRASVNPLDSFNRLGRSQSLKGRSSLAPKPKADEFLRPTRSFGAPHRASLLPPVQAPAAKSTAAQAPRLPNPLVRKTSGSSMNATMKKAPAPVNGISIRVNAKGSLSASQPPSSRGLVPSTSNAVGSDPLVSVLTKSAGTSEPVPQSTAVACSAAPERPLKRSFELSAIPEGPSHDASANLSVDSQPSAPSAGPSCSTPFRTSVVPLPPDTARQSAPRPKRNVPHSSSGRSKASSSASSSSPPPPAKDEAPAVPSGDKHAVVPLAPQAKSAECEAAEQAPAKRARTSIFGAVREAARKGGLLPAGAPFMHPVLPDRASKVSEAVLETTKGPQAAVFGRAAPPFVTTAPSVAPSTGTITSDVLKRKPSVRFTIALAAPAEEPTVPSASSVSTVKAGPRATSTTVSSVFPPSASVAESKSPGKRATSQPLLTVPKAFSFAAPRSISASHAGGAEGGTKPSARELAAQRAEEKLKAKREQGVTVGSGSGWGKPSSALSEAKARKETGNEEDAHTGKRARMETVEVRQPLSKPALPGRRTTSGNGAPGLYGNRPRLPSGHRQRPPLSEKESPQVPAVPVPLTAAALEQVTGAVGNGDEPISDAELVIREAEAELRRGMEKEAEVVKYLEGVQRAVEADEKTKPADDAKMVDSDAADEDEEVSVMLCGPIKPAVVEPPTPPVPAPARPAATSAQQAQDRLDVGKPAPRKVSASMKTAVVGTRKVSSSATTKLTDAKRTISSSTAVLQARRANVDVPASKGPQRSVSGEKAAIRPAQTSAKPAGSSAATGLTRSLSSANFQKRLSQWREAESRRPAAAPLPRPSVAASSRAAPQPQEWQDVSLVHHVLPVKARTASTAAVSFGFATEKRRRERELYEMEKKAREEMEEERRKEAEERRRKVEEVEVREMRRARVPVANPVPEWYAQKA